MFSRGTLFAAPRFGSCGVISVIAAMLLSSIGTADAWSRAMARHPPKHHGPKLAALTPEPFIRELAAKHPPSSSVAGCTPAKFRIVLDVGHTAESEGAISARNVAEFVFNLHLAQRIAEKLKADGFTETRLLVTEGKAKPSLFKRVAAANDLGANLFLSIHHDSVPDNMLEAWEYGGRKSHFSDRFSGYSVFVSHDNPDFQTSLRFAELIGKEMKADGLNYANQYTLPIMGRNQHELLDKDTGVYRYDQLVVLRKTRMPAVLLEAGSISNRDEEVAMGSPERQEMISNGVTEAVKEFCDPRWAILGPL
ncbi:MAG TPA: N-acetylmuramoyl-L-alanine amidase [Bradyrhizobium sp.]|nr:N-acetylmuramoyl-L-alanine amidase [Bradyrhizobium sp.]